MKGLLRFLINNKVIFAFLVIFSFFALFIPNFYSVNNILSVGKQIAVNGILAAGMTMVIITGGIDLSVGSMLALGGVFCATLFKAGFDPFLAIMITIGIGALTGSANGLVITKIGIPPFITTLATLSIVRGAALAIGGGKSVSGLGPVFAFIGRGELFGFPMPLVIMIVIFLVTGFTLSKTRYGVHLYAIGGGEDTSRVLGLKVNQIKVLVYSINGALAALAAILQMSRLNSGQPLTGVSAELDAIAAVVVGGTSLNGGRGRIIGTVFGVAIIGMLTNGLILLNLSFYYQLAVKGLVILLAVGMSTERKKN